MPVRVSCATPMNQVESEIRSEGDGQARGILDLLGWRNAISVDQIRANQRADQPYALFYQIDRDAMQFEVVAPTNILTQIEGWAIADLSAHLIDPCPNRYHRCGIIPSPGQRRQHPNRSGSRYSRCASTIRTSLTQAYNGDLIGKITIVRSAGRQTERSSRRSRLRRCEFMSRLSSSAKLADCHSKHRERKAASFLPYLCDGSDHGTISPDDCCAAIYHLPYGMIAICSTEPRFSGSWQRRQTKFGTSVF